MIALIRSLCWYLLLFLYESYLWKWKKLSRIPNKRVGGGGDRGVNHSLEISGKLYKKSDISFLSRMSLWTLKTEKFLPPNVGVIYPSGVVIFWNTKWGMKIDRVYSAIYICNLWLVQVESWHTRRRQTNGRCKRFHDRELPLPTSKFESVNSKSWILNLIQPYHFERGLLLIKTCPYRSVTPEVAPTRSHVRSSNLEVVEEVEEVEVEDE